MLAQPSIRRLKRIVRRMKPFKGNCAYESQLFNVVVQWRHDGKGWTHPRGFHLGNLIVWRDSMWRW